ncbi:MAG: cytochrome d ubiquinol oxidase subunit II [Arenimonas sp.]|jgi:cytochrome d ubiquinol oxidase subunit II
MNVWLPTIFVFLMALSMLIYVVLDGYDLGVGILLRRANDAHKDEMIASIGPFWDANETWLVLGIGILLVAFPVAHGVILGGLYLPVAFMLAGLILRGVAFDFRVKAHDDHRAWWNRAFYFGSLLAALSQGFMLGIYLLGFQYSVASVAFASFIALSLVAGYALLGATWLILKSENSLLQLSIRWARASLWLTGVGIVAVSIATPLVSSRIFDKWFVLPNLFLLAPIPLLTLAVFAVCDRTLARMLLGKPHRAWLPFACAVALFLLAFIGLAYSLFPYLVVDRITYLDAATAPESLKFMLVGIAITLPVILGYTAYSYRVFWGKTRDLSY